MSTWRAPYLSCETCIEYLDARKSVLSPALAERADETGENVITALTRYMAGVHARHLSGLPILPGTAA
jgi:hypothetical protein